MAEYEQKDKLESKKYIDSSTEYKIFNHIQNQLDIYNFTPRNYFELRNFCYYGYVNNFLRPKFWKLFLCYLPKNKFKTEHHLKDRRKLYHFYLEKSMAVRSENPGIDDIIEKDIQRMCIKPINEYEPEEMNWGGPVQSNEQKGLVLKEKQQNIELNSPSDTLDDEKFTNSVDLEEKTVSESEHSSSERNVDTLNELKANSVEKQSKSKVLERKCEFLDSGENIIHRQALKRILLTFKVTNSSIGYTQGMHMVLAPIYYVFATSEDIDDQKFAEEDAFFCFFNLMSEIGENFIQEYDDDCRVGIKKKMEMIFDIVKENDKELYDVMDKKGLIETHFAFRWISLLLCSEFEMDQIVILWDKIFADSYRFEILIYCCAAILILMKKAIVECEFDECMKILQINKKIDVMTVFTLADKMRREMELKNRK